MTSHVLKNYLVGLLILSCCIAQCQSLIDWDSEYELKLEDFKSPQTEINEALTSYAIYSGAYLDFSFSMPGAVFMMTKNFNSKAKTVFDQNSSIITAPDSATALQLVRFGKFNFDLVELYTRKFRKRLHEEKGAFSDVDFFRPIFDELQAEQNAESARVLKATDLGKDEYLLEVERQKVRDQIAELAAYCFGCKPPKRKKNKK